VILTLPPGTLQHTTLDGEPVVLVATTPHGLPAILSLRGWRLLSAWKLTTLTTARGQVQAYGRGYSGLPLVSRLLTDTTSKNLVVTHRNRNPLDLREGNLVVMTRSQVKAARKKSPNAAKAALPPTTQRSETRHYDHSQSFSSDARRSRRPC
jgi:hypothetical protein